MAGEELALLDVRRAYFYAGGQGQVSVCAGRIPSMTS